MESTIRSGLCEYMCTRTGLEALCTIKGEEGLTETKSLERLHYESHGNEESKNFFRRPETKFILTPISPLILLTDLVA